MSLRICFDLDDDDLQHLKMLMKQASRAGREVGDKKILKKCRKMIGDVEKAKAPEFIKERIRVLGALIDMVEDKSWNLPEPERDHVLQALVYFSDPEDLIPDQTPGLGFLDDAIMIELVGRELKPELDAYRDFVAFRDAEIARRGLKAKEIGRAEWLEEQRHQLIDRMRRRRRARGSGRNGRGSAFSFW